MAKFFPTFKDLESLKQKPTEGEYHALEILKNLSDEYEVYFQPYVNGYNPDIIIIKKNYGVLILEVKDWQLQYYIVDEKDNWSLVKDNTPIKSPVKQVRAYKNNLYDLSIPSMLCKKIKNIRSYGIVQVAVYFHNEKSSSIREKNIEVDEYCPIFGKDNFNVNILLNHKYIFRKYKNSLFDDTLYEEFHRVLKPSFHTLEQAQEVILSPKQKALAQSRAKQQKIRGVAGSGKTVVLAKRAVNSHIRHGEKVLILTYNITLRNYIHDNLNRVREKFSWEYFHINHYHGFMTSMANNKNIKVNSLADHDDEEIFESVKDKLPKYKAIFIDEIQDYQKSWVKIIKKYFLADKGELVVFGDEKQNIYDTELDNSKKPYTGIGGAWLKLDHSHRLSNKILNLAEAFQSYFFENKYELDKAIPKQQTLNFEEKSIEYHKLDDNLSLADLSNLIINKLKKNSIQPQDVCILAQSNGLLRSLDFEIRKNKKQKTYTTFETQEMYDSLLEKNLSEKEFKCSIRKIQTNKRFNFWMNSAGLKLSTIHSFKGWEIDTLFLIIDGESKFESNEKIYTAITRCRSRLVVLNLNHTDYDIFFSKNIKSNERTTSISKNIDTKKTIIESVLQREVTDNNIKKLDNLLSENSGREVNILKEKVSETEDHTELIPIAKNKHASSEILNKPSKSADFGVVPCVVKNQNKYEKSNQNYKKTVRETIQKDNLSNFQYNFAQLKINGKFIILILGETSEDKNKFQEALNNHLSKYNIKPNEWDIDLWSNKKIKNKSLKSLKKGQSKYNLIVTAQIYHHSSKGNKEQNLLKELKGRRYIDVEIGCKPQSLLTVNSFIDKIDEYISKQN